MIRNFEQLANRFARIFGCTIDVKDEKNVDGFTLPKCRGPSGSTTAFDWFTTMNINATREAYIIKKFSDELDKRLTTVSYKERTNINSFKIIIGIILLMVSGVCNIIGITYGDIKNFNWEINLTASIQGFGAMIFAIMWIIYFFYSEYMPFGYLGIVFAHLVIFGVTIFTLSLIPESTKKFTEKTALSFVLYAASIGAHLMYFGIILGSFIETKKKIYILE